MIRLGLIGAGGYGRMHLDGFLSLQQEGLLRITAVVDPSPEVLGDAGRMPALKGARCFADYRELLADGELDAVVISAPIPWHEEMALAALERDVFVLLEKPPVPLLGQLENLIGADRNGRVMVAFQHIYSELIGNLKRDLVDGRIGRILAVSAQGLWPRPSSYYGRAAWAGRLQWEGRAVFDGPCTNAMAHFVNLGFYLAGEEAESFGMPEEVSGELYRARPGLASYDTGCLAGHLKTGARFFMGFSHAGAELSPVELSIRGTNGNLLLLEDGQCLCREDGTRVPGDDGRDRMRRAFLRFAGGEGKENRTPLHALRPYVLATNLMLLSSKGVRDISGEYVTPVDPGTDRAIFEIGKIVPVLRQCAEQAIPFSQGSVPWARRSRSLNPGHFSVNELWKRTSALIQ